VPNKAFHITK
jgi:hypothetical protein